VRWREGCDVLLEGFVSIEVLEWERRGHYDGERRRFPSEEIAMLAL
jgi:hypothetical protein